MNTVDLTDLTKEILASKTESAMLVGISWAEVLPEDRMVRLLVIQPDQSIDAPPKTFLVFMHEMTRLNLKNEDKVIAHQGPGDIDIHRTVLIMDNVSYGIAHRTPGSWEFFSQTHEF